MQKCRGPKFRPNFFEKQETFTATLLFCLQIHFYGTFISHIYSLKNDRNFQISYFTEHCEQLFYKFLKKNTDNYPVNTYLITVNEGSIRTMHEICPKLTIRTPQANICWS